MWHSHIKSEEVWRSPSKKNMQLLKYDFAEICVLVNAADVSGKEYLWYKGDFFSLFPVLKAWQRYKTFKWIFFFLIATVQNIEIIPDVSDFLLY